MDAKYANTQVQSNTYNSMFSSTVTNTSGLVNNHNNNSSGRPSSELQVKLLSYNIFLRPPLVKTNASDYKDLRLRLFGEQMMQRFDIICVQELFCLGNFRVKTFLNYATKAGLVHHARMNCYFSPWNFKVFDSGLAIVSKYPIDHIDYKIYKSGTAIDKYAMKGVLCAHVNVSPECSLLVFTTHLQAIHKESHLKCASNVQYDQLVEMCSFVSRKHREYPKSNIVLMGDFNINARSSSMQLGYTDMMKLLHLHTQLSWIDTYFHVHNSHPVTYADAIQNPQTGAVEPRETVLTDKRTHLEQACLDYALFSDTQGTSGSSTKCQLYNAKVEEFFVKNEQVTQLSDHYGVSMLLKVKVDNTV